ncbi:nucleoside:proton symporter [Roseococcus sp. SYP-B2431]|uniref:NupC/NupG family nucleoside CNT transporter n=1 Tax=Roseococcus sp. SYP-B2431 TaxID=2496640 RepID=UPI00103DBB76|nr:nucleoside transporter C-terminal domain-containing protein [Roseococcus sp. SYP-B2431]TCH98851.1 nucleoside:proton symporter [Roseococcus sp. SYP-B2431]
MSLPQLQSALGLVLLCLLCWVLGGCKRHVSWRAVIGGLVGTIGLAALLLNIPPLRAAFSYFGRAVDALARATQAGTSLVFGYLGGAPLPYAETAPGASFILFFQALPILLLVGALSALLYHWRVLPFVVRILAIALRRCLGLGGAAGFSVAANVFVGMVEAPLLIRPWLSRLTRSELFVVMVAGLATISGNMLVVYALLISSLVPDAAGQLLTASLMGAPAAVLAAQLMIPSTGITEGEAEAPRLYSSSMEALVQGTSDGLQLLLGIMAALVVFVALVALGNEIVQPILGITLQQIAGWVLWPLAWAMGTPAAEAQVVGQSLGIKLVINEFVAYLDFARSSGEALSPRTRLILSYALCGFANFGSVGIMLGGMCTMCPERRAEIVSLGLPALAAGTIACCMLGAAVGVLTPP